MNLSEIKNETEAIYDLYRSRFAGMARATRDVAELDEIIQRLKDVISVGERQQQDKRDPALASVLETARENLAIYENERAEIRKVQTQPHARLSAVLATRANRCFDVYGRHFAGKDRATRDVRLLMDLVNELEDLQARMEVAVENGAEASRGDLETVNRHIDLYNDEVDAIRKGRATGTADEQASRLAILANDQFKLYNQHFAGKSRVTRRPELIIRMIENLEDYLKAMQILASGGYNSEQNVKNMGIVEGNLEMYRTELEAIRGVRQETGAQDLAGALGGAANEIMSEYRDNYAGKDRRGRDLERLGVLCDQLRDVFLQMNAISRAMDLDFNNRNMEIVSEARANYEAEWREIQSVQ